MVESVLTEAIEEKVTGLRPRSPAAHLTTAFAAAEVTGPRAVRIREVPFLTMVGLRALPGSTAASLLEDRLGAALPTVCGQVTSDGGTSVLWLSPDEFLAVSERPWSGLATELADAIAGEPGSAIDLSANRTTFELVGPMAREVLAKGCPLDLHPRAFSPGTAFVTTVGPVPVILWKVEKDLHRVLPRASFADFLGRWLLDAMDEFQAPEIP